MPGDGYVRPGFEDRTAITEPLNTVSTSHGLLRTPVWRSRATGPDAAYEPPRVEEHTPVRAPLNAAISSLLPRTTPKWRAKGDGREHPPVPDVEPGGGEE
jgi:hypothetical protein